MEVQLESFTLVIVSTLLNCDGSGDERGVLDSYCFLLDLSNQETFEVNLVLVESDERVLAHGRHLEDSSLLLFPFSELADHGAHDDLGLSAVKNDSNFFLLS